MQNALGQYILPGSSLKGMLRSIVEALGNGCLTLFDGDYERDRQTGEFIAAYKRKVGEQFQHCWKNTELCLTCRVFGMLKVRSNRSEDAAGVFLGKVNISDAVVDAEKCYKYDPMYTAVLVEPKPHHDAFYLDETRQHIAGRKFYFHHSPDKEPLQDNRIVLMGGRPANKFIQPLDYDTVFHFRIDFTNLEADEMGALLLAITLEEKMRHKIGYGKPTGLGSVELRPVSLTLVDYAARYGSDPARGKSVLTGDTMWDTVYKLVDDFSEKKLATLAITDLRRIWRWPPEPGTDYYYPGKRDWFDTAESRGVRIKDTRRVP